MGYFFCSSSVFSKNFPALTGLNQVYFHNCHFLVDQKSQSEPKMC